MGGLISALASWLGVQSVARFLALKLVLYTLIVVILPIVLWNFGIEWMQAIIGLALSALPSGSFVYHAVGLAGWFAVQLQLEQVITILVSALATRFIINIIT